MGLLILRVATGWLLAAHGLQKTTSLFGGRGLQGGVEEFREDGFRGGALTALAAGLGQVGAGLLFSAGLATPLAAATAIGVMVVAVTVKWAHGPWSPHDGYEYPAYLVLAAAVLALTGPGRWSVDDVIGRAAWPAWTALAAIGLGVASGLGTRVLLGGGAGAGRGAR